MLLSLLFSVFTYPFIISVVNRQFTSYCLNAFVLLADTLNNGTFQVYIHKRSNIYETNLVVVNG